MDMTRTAIISTFVTLLPVLALAQAAPKHLEFEVASIRPVAPQEGRADIGMHIDGSQVRFNFLTVGECMQIAWQVKQYQVVGPEWVTSDRFNITAKIPDGAGGADNVREMLQNLIQDRFKLTFHKEKRDVAVFALIYGKAGLKMKETPPDGTEGAEAPKGLNISASGSAAGVHVDFGNGSYYTFADNKLVGHKLTMAWIADTLSRYTDLPVIDMTGAPATKYYDFSFDITADDYRTMLIRTAIKAGVSLPPEAVRLADLPTDSLFSAMEAAGIKLESRKAPQDVMVVDHADKTPTEN